MGNSIMATIIRFFDNCDECKSETRSLWKLGIKLENRTLCRPCYESALEDVKCGSGPRTLCKNIKCKSCYNKSLASAEKVFSIDFAEVFRLGLKHPRFVCKKSNQKYPFICDVGHRWSPSPKMVAHGSWCSNANCIREKHEQTCMRNYGVKHPLQSKEIRERSERTCLSNYGVKNPFQSEEIKQRMKETCLAVYGVEYACQSEEVRNKIKETCLMIYGVDNPFKSERLKRNARKHAWPYMG